MSEYNRETGFLTITLDKLHDFHSTAVYLPEEDRNYRYGIILLI